MKSSVMVLFLCALLAGCATSGPKLSGVDSALPAIPDGKGRIVFYRVEGFKGGALKPAIRLNGHVIGTSKPTSFFFVDQAPGEYVVSVRTGERGRDEDITSGEKFWDGLATGYILPGRHTGTANIIETVARAVDGDVRSVQVVVNAGKSSFVRTKPEMGLLVGQVVVELVDESSARPAIQDLAYIGDPRLIARSLLSNSAIAAPGTQTKPAVKVSARASVSEVTNDVTPALSTQSVKTNTPASNPTIATITPLDAATASTVGLAPPAVNFSAKDRKLGTWSYEAEQFANANGCNSDNTGAWLVGKADYAEHYLISCKDGHSFTAVCDQVACQAG